MSLEIKTAASVNFNVNNNVTLTYDNTVQQYMLGFQNFDLSYGSDDHHVDILSVSFSSTTKSGNTVSATVAGQMSDASGNSMNNGSSSALVSGIAWVGATPNDAAVTLVPPFASGSSSNAVAITGPNPTVLQPAMAGFYVTYGSGVDHHVENLSLSMNATSSGSEATVSGTVFLDDASGHDGSNATITPGLLAGTGTGRGFVVSQQTVTTQVNSFTVDLSSLIEQDLNVSNLNNYAVNITGAAALITGFSITYPGNDDHHVKVISVGCWGGLTQTPGTLQLTGNNVGAWMYDDSDNQSDPTQSTVTMALIATYTATPK